METIRPPFFALKIRLLWVFNVVVLAWRLQDRLRPIFGRVEMDRRSLFLMLALITGALACALGWQALNAGATRDDWTLRVSVFGACAAVCASLEFVRLGTRENSREPLSPTARNSARWTNLNARERF